MFKFIFWPFKKIKDWLASGLPAGKEEITPAPTQPEILKCYTHKRYKKSCPICVSAAGNS